MYNKPPKVSIVGAGPGDPDLLTLKAIKAINNADVILYDALVSDAILALAKSETELIYVGKRSAQHAYKQEEIHELLVKYALLFGHVVRLKGGDPFVFGRGGEEMEYVRAAGIEVQIIPGISSSIGVPGSVGIPVTHRGLSESFWVLTATNKKGELANDIHLAAQTNTTAVILMGLNKLREIVQLYTNHHPSDWPVAVIQDGTLPTQKVVTGTLENIISKVQNKEVKSPAIIIVGEVVSLYQEPQLANFSKEFQYHN